MLSAVARDLVEGNEIRELPTLIAKREPPGFTESQIGSQAGILGRH
jgi:hypothetical protein